MHALGEDWRRAELTEVDAALCAFAEKLSREPAAMREEDVAALRGLGLDDAAIHEAIQVVSYFNYINRVADATGVDLEPEMPPRPRRGGSDLGPEMPPRPRRGGSDLGPKMPPRPSRG